LTLRLAFLLGLCCTIGVVGLRAQTPDEFGAWAGASVGSPTLIGKTKPVSLFIAGLRYSRVVAKGPPVTLRYTADLIPIARLTYAAGSISGKGASPIGFEMDLPSLKRVQPLASISGGFIYFDQNVPRDGGARFNFSAAMGAGVRITIGRSIVSEAGYKYHHLSNDYRAAANPGFDSHLLLLGVSLQR
jgi:hypothetical protein